MEPQETTEQDEQTPAAQPQDDFQETDFKEPENVEQSVNQASPMQFAAQQFEANRAAHKQDLVNEDQAFAQDLANGHIQPKTYRDLFADKGTLGKIGTLFGMLVGSAGSALAHQPNAILQMMDNQIQNDLKAQIQSKQNAHNFWNLNQADLANKVGAMQGVEGVKTAAFARTQAQAYQTSYHHLLQMVQNMPPQQQQKARAALMALYPVMSQKINNAHDLAASAMAAQGINPFSQSGSASPEGGAAPVAETTAKKGGEKQQAEAEENDHILRPGASESFTRAQYNPLYKQDSEQVKEQLERAALADKAIDAIKKHFPEMFANVKNKAHDSGAYGPDKPASAGVGSAVKNVLSDASGYIHRKAQNMEAIPYVGEAIGGLGKAVTDTQKNRDYDLHRAAVTPALQAVFTRAGMNSLQAEHALDSVLPEIGDDPSMAINKIKAAIEKIKQATPTDALERHGLANVAKKRKK